MWSSLQEGPRLQCRRLVYLVILHPRDKCGAFAFAGTLKTISDLQTTGVKVVMASRSVVRVTQTAVKVLNLVNYITSPPGEERSA